MPRYFVLLTAADGSFTPVDPAILPVVLAAQQAEEENDDDDVATDVQPRGSSAPASG